MALVHSFERSGNFLFKYRGQIPVILFVLAIPVIYVTDLSGLSSNEINVYTTASIALSVLGFVIRAYTIGTTPKHTSGRNTSEQVAEVLNSTGIYAIVRHPLYLGNYFMWIGIVAYTFNLWFVLAVSLAYWLYYERIMFAEERFLERKFGESYVTWSNKVPAFWPKFSLWVKSVVPFSMKPVLRREYSGFLATVVGFLFVDFLRYFIPMAEHGQLEHFSMPDKHYIIFGVAVAITLLFRSLTKYTSLFDEEGRS